MRAILLSFDLLPCFEIRRVRRSLSTALENVTRFASRMARAVTEATERSIFVFAWIPGTCILKRLGA